ncbi:hypothetical protein [Flexithrix dorotheae]|uniref:hypothetical protein n=1 Tax=Flexithrix dorotheae TaxID=70993 RepID=UPI000366C092|nr:hypothetical protein [Flexithrix dorotheae]
MEWINTQGIHLKRKKKSAVILLIGVILFILLNKFDISSSNVDKVMALTLLVITFFAAEYLTFLRLKKKKRKKMKKFHKHH